MFRQRTLKRVVKISGIGIHSGKKVNLVLRPAPVNTGIIFKRVDLKPEVSIPAKAHAVGETVLSSCLTEAGVRISTVEHLMAAFAGLGIDNLYVDVDAEEIPIMDGSAAPFVWMLQETGLFEQYATKRFLKIKKEVRVEQADKKAILRPYEGFKLDFTLKYEHPVFMQSPQRIEFNFGTDSFIEDLSRARTFGLLSDYDRLRAANLALGGSLDNAVVVDDYKVVNPEGLRYEDEFVRHKILDAVGDLYMLGHNLIGAFVGYKSGHALNNLLVRKLLEDAEAWEYTTLEQDAEHQLFPQLLLQTALS